MVEKQEAIKDYRTIIQYCNDQQPDCSACIFAHWYDDGDAACEFDLYPHPMEWTYSGGFDND